MPKFSFTKLVDIDRDKFFAISTERWFQNDQPDTKYGTRENIAKNNPALYDLMSMYYPTEPWTYCDT